MTKLIFNLVKIVLIITLPFILLIRGAVYIHENYNLGAYSSLIGGGIVAAFLLIIYFTVIYGSFTKKTGDAGSFKRRGIIALLIVMGYCIHGLFFISNNNMKSSEVKKEMLDLHPILRVAVSTIIFIDKDLIITDASRVKEDYRKMGLPTKSSSLHYKQKDSHAYAMDLRTNSRSEVRNFFLKSYFYLMGFNTLRHGGTGDHLHISLKCHYRPGAI